MARSTNAPDDPTSDTACAGLFEVVYEDLRRLAHAKLRRLPTNHPLQATELVHDVFLRVQQRNLPADNGPAQARARFFSAAARVMRDLLVEHARRRASLKRGGGQSPCPTGDADIAEACCQPGEFENVDLIALDEALERLAAIDEQKHEVVMLRFFMQLAPKEVAEVLQVCERTVERHWNFARAWLHQQLSVDG